MENKSQLRKRRKEETKDKGVHYVDMLFVIVILLVLCMQRNMLLLLLLLIHRTTVVELSFKY